MFARACSGGVGLDPSGWLAAVVVVEGPSTAWTAHASTTFEGVEFRQEGERLMSDRPTSAFICTITPLTENDTIDEEAIRLLFGRFIDAGVGAFVGTASPGEGQALSLAETETLYGVAHEVLKGKTGVRAMGCEPRTAKEFQQLIKIAESVGMDAMQLYSLDLGHGQKPTDPEL